LQNSVDRIEGANADRSASERIAALARSSEAPLKARLEKNPKYGTLPISTIVPAAAGNNGQTRAARRPSAACQKRSGFSSPDR